MRWRSASRRVRGVRAVHPRPMHRGAGGVAVDARRPPWGAAEGCTAVLTVLYNRGELEQDRRSIRLCRFVPLCLFVRCRLVTGRPNHAQLTCRHGQQACACWSSPAGRAATFISMRRDRGSPPAAAAGSTLHAARPTSMASSTARATSTACRNLR